MSTMRPPSAPFGVPGEDLAQVDEYVVLQVLGRGAMGDVFLARDTRLDRLVALKFLRIARPVDRECLLIEARALAQLHHPNVVSVYRVGEHAGRPYLVSEYLRGQSLAQTAKPLSEKQVVEVALGLLHGLGAAHRKGIVHRDVKPANALLTEEGEVKLLDFGLAKLPDAAMAPSPPVLAEPRAVLKDPAATLSLVPADGTGEVARHPVPDQQSQKQDETAAGATPLGTPYYMAPELWRGEQATQRSDLYALGALLYELCCGRPPHDYPTVEEVKQAAKAAPIPPLAARAPLMDPRLLAAIERCLRHNPAERPRSVEEVLRELLPLTFPAGQANTPTGNPFRGLRPFEAEHRALFFGRSAEVQAVLERLRADPMVVVTGDSGVGKSSLCRAGVLPSVLSGAIGEGRSWQAAMLTPGRWPMLALATALAPHMDSARDVEKVRTELNADPERTVARLLDAMGKTRGLILFVDQLEELNTQSDVTESVVFGELLAHLARRLPGLRMLATVRGDFLWRLLESADIEEELRQALYVLRPLGESALREIIAGPAKLRGVSFETEDMVTTMAKGAAAARGALPLLEFALATLWDRRDCQRNIIPADALSGIGGVGGALAMHADAALAQLTLGEQQAARRLLCRLVTREGSRLTLGEGELLAGTTAAAPAMQSAREALVRARLIVVRQTEAGQ